VSLRVELTVDGGFAAIPGLAAPLRLDGAGLSDSQCARLRQLVEASLREPSVPAPAHARDARRYRVTIERDGEQCAIEASDAAMPAACGELIEFLKTNGKRG
jgi:hypothetical protein